VNSSTRSMSERGRISEVPVIEIAGVPMTLTGRLIREARVFDEDWQAASALPDPLVLLGALKGGCVRADLFTFAQHVPDVTPRYPFQLHLENAAVATIDSYESWLAVVDRSVRKHLKKAQREGVKVQESTLDEEFVRGISSIYNELPVRQGRRFWHYGKSIDQVRAENSTYLDRSILLGAYLQGDLIGFAKLVVDGQVASIMQILSKGEHFAKRPTNALIAKAAELCAARTVRYLIYGAHTYGNQEHSTLTDFKENSGFRRVDYPRYFVPLSNRGRVALALGLQQRWVDRLPVSLRNALWQTRARYHARS